MLPLLNRLSNQIAGSVSCFDRVILQGRMPMLSYADGMARFLTARAIRIFDFVKWAAPFTQSLIDHTEALASQIGMDAPDFIRKKNFRKEDKIQRILQQRGTHPGLVWIFSALEPCTTYAPRYSRNAKRSFLTAKDKKCKHYYFYFIDEVFGLCYLRVPTWAPFRIQVYFNIHNWLARQLDQAHIPYRLLDNAFVQIGDWEQAQRICDGFDVALLHQRLTLWVATFCPGLLPLEQPYNWTIDTAEYATDVVFHRQQDLQPLYQAWVRTAIHTVKPRDIATFLGRKLNGNYQGEMGNRYNTRIEGTRLRHSMGLVSLKMYDKFGHVLRIETTVKDVTFFRHRRQVEHHDGTSHMKVARMKKTIYSLGALRECSFNSNCNYLKFLASLDDPRIQLRDFQRVTEKIAFRDRSYRGLNFFDPQDVAVLEAIAQGEFCIAGMRNKTLRPYLPGRNSAQISRTLKRLRLHGLIKKNPRSYSYYLTGIGRAAIAAGLRHKEFVIIPQFSQTAA